MHDRRKTTISLLLLTFSLGAAISCRKSGEASSPDKTPATNEPKSAGGSAEAKSLTQVIDELCAAWEKVTTVSASVNSEAKREFADKADSKGKGVYNYKRENGRTYIHYYLNNDINFWYGTDHYMTMERVEWVTDGEFMEHLVLQYENRRRVRSKYDPKNVLQLGGKLVLDPLREANELKLTGTEVFHGRDVYVIESKPRNGDWSGLHFFDKNTGIRTKWVETVGNGEKLLELTVPDITLNPSFSDASFKMTHYENVEFVDEITGQVIPPTPPTVVLPGQQPPPPAEQEPKPKEPTPR